MSNNFLDVDGARAFASFLEENKTLQQIRINKCSLGQKSCELILKAIEKNTDINLHTMNLSNNDFGKDGMTILGQLVARMSRTLQSLELRNLIEKDKPHNGLGPMLEGISECKRLKYLDVTGNNYNGQMSAVDSLLKVIDKCESMAVLRMSNLGFDEKACEHFMKGLRTHITRKWGLLNNLQFLEWKEDVFDKAGSAVTDKHVID